MACAIGHATRIQSFHGDGFRSEKVYGLGSAPHFSGMSGWLAVRLFFEVSKSDALWLFAEHSYDPGATPDIVADRIAGFLKDTMEKYCTNCKHAIKRNLPAKESEPLVDWGRWTCAAVGRNPVSGWIWIISCVDERQASGDCGPDGKMFESIDP